MYIRHVLEALVLFPSDQCPGSGSYSRYKVLIPGWNINVPGTGGPTITQRFMLHVQGSVNNIIPPKGPPSCAEAFEGVKKTVTVTSKTMDANM